MSGSPITGIIGLVSVASRTLPGIDVHQHSYQFTGDATDITVRALLAGVSEARELTFFDPGHPQRTEPGAFISLVRSPEGLLAQAANHGWSSSWVPIGQDEAERYLQLCMPFHTQPQSEQLVFTEPSNWRQRGSVSKKMSGSFRSFLAERLARTR